MVVAGDGGVLRPAGPGGACGIAGRRACYEGGRGGSRWNSGSADCGHGMAMKAAGPGRASRDATGSGWDAGAMAGTRICVARRPGSAHHLRMAAVTDSALNQRPAADIGAGDGGQRANQHLTWPGCLAEQRLPDEWWRCAGGGQRAPAASLATACVSCAGQLSVKHMNTRCASDYCYFTTVFCSCCYVMSAVLRNEVGLEAIK